MSSKSSCYPVDGSLEIGPEGKAQRFVSGVTHAAGRPDRFTGGMRQLEVSIYCLKTGKDRTPLLSVDAQCKARVVNLFVCCF